MIELVHLEKQYGATVPLADVNAVINDGDVISIIGPSGTGKSTFRRARNITSSWPSRSWAKTS